MVTGTVSPATQSGAADVATAAILLPHSPCVVQHCLQTLDPRPEGQQHSHLETNVCSSSGCREKLEHAGLREPLSLDITWAIKGSSGYFSPKSCVCKASL